MTEREITSAEFSKFIKVEATRVEWRGHSADRHNQRDLFPHSVSDRCSLLQQSELASLPGRAAVMPFCCVTGGDKCRVCVAEPHLCGLFPLIFEPFILPAADTGPNKILQLPRKGLGGWGGEGGNCFSAGTGGLHWQPHFEEFLLCFHMPFENLFLFSRHFSSTGFRMMLWEKQHQHPAEHTLRV